MFDRDYWEKRYQNDQLGWDIGYVSTPIKSYIDQLKDKSLKILVPGAGNGYEVQYLHGQGFDHVFMIDIAQEPLESFQKRVPSFPKERLLHQDFFDHEGKYDLIIEQTFFCALSPDMREAYVKKMHGLLQEGGKLAGLLFNIPLYDDHPPFGGNREIYLSLFSACFDIDVMEEAYNSIPPRLGSELFIRLTKK